jgi:hypothetical protein
MHLLVLLSVSCIQDLNIMQYSLCCSLRFWIQGNCQKYNLPLYKATISTPEDLITFLKDYCIKHKLHKKTENTTWPCSSSILIINNYFAYPAINNKTNISTVTYHKRNLIKTTNPHFNEVFHTTRCPYDDFLVAQKQKKSE